MPFRPAPSRRLVAVAVAAVAFLSGAGAAVAQADELPVADAGAPTLIHHSEINWSAPEDVAPAANPGVPAQEPAPAATPTPAPAKAKVKQPRRARAGSARQRSLPRATARRACG